MLAPPPNYELKDKAREEGSGSISSSSSKSSISSSVIAPMADLAPSFERGGSC